MLLHCSSTASWKGLVYKEKTHLIPGVVESNFHCFNWKNIEWIKKQPFSPEPGIMAVKYQQERCTNKDSSACAGIWSGKAWCVQVWTLLEGNASCLVLQLQLWKHLYKTQWKKSCSLPCSTNPAQHQKLRDNLMATISACWPYLLSHTSCLKSVTYTLQWLVLLLISH